MLSQDLRFDIFTGCFDMRFELGGGITKAQRSHRARRDAAAQDISTAGACWKRRLHAKVPSEHMLHLREAVAAGR